MNAAERLWGALSTSVRADAPGKLFVSGEWAVLRGAPALVAAVDRRVRVEIAQADGDGVVVESLAEDRAERVDGAGPVPAGDAGVVVAALRAAHRQPAGLFVRIDGRAFVDGGRKLGLGRSAATLVAAVAALAPRAARDGVLASALAANAIFQGGQGSGADVGASVHGGLVEVRRAGGAHVGLRVTARALPAGLHLVAGWTRTSAHTPPLLARFAAAEPPAVFAELAAAAASAAEAVALGDAGGLLEAVDRSGDLLARFGREVGLPVVTPELAALVEAARRAGAAAKPSGAGGGDCGIALCRSAAEARAVRAAWRDAGIVPLDLTVAPEGVRVG